MSRVYKVGWGDEWPQLEISVPDDAELAMFDAVYEPHVTEGGIGGFAGLRTARTLHVKLVFIDLDDPTEVGHEIARHPSGRTIGIVRGEDGK